MNVKGVTEVGRRLNVARLGLAIVILAAIAYAIIWFFVLRTEPASAPTTPPGKQHESSQGANQTPPPAPAPGSGKSDNSASGTTNGGSSASSGASGGTPSQPQGLINTGPGSNLAIFAGASVIAYAVRYRYLRSKSGR